MAASTAHSQQRLRKHDFKVSVSGKGNCDNNSAVESFIKSLKAELIWRHNWHAPRQVKVARIEDINGICNARFKHPALGWKSPLACDHHHPQNPFT